MRVHRSPLLCLEEGKYRGPLWPGRTLARTEISFWRSAGLDSLPPPPSPRSLFPFWRVFSGSRGKGTFFFGALSLFGGAFWRVWSSTRVRLSSADLSEDLVTIFPFILALKCFFGGYVRARIRVCVCVRAPGCINSPPPPFSLY